MDTTLWPTSTPLLLEAAVEAATRALAAGEPVALPSETVYGLAADALRPEAVLKIFEAKERPFFDPLIVHLPSLEWLERVCAIPEESRALVAALIAKFWPGPLTLVLPRRGQSEADFQSAFVGPRQTESLPHFVPDLVTSGLETVAVRMPAHPVFRAVLARFGRPLAAPSANRFGRISPTTAAHVQSELAGRIPLILDGGATEHGLESTIVKIEGARLQILRAGPITPEMLADAAQASRLPESRTDVSACPQPPLVEAPGQLKSHYAPRTPLRLLGSAGFQPVPGGILPASDRLRLEAEADGMEARAPLGLLAWRAPADAARFAAMEILSPTGDLREAAATLFAKMRRLDEAGLDLILAEPVPEHGLGIAIMDRLRKAAAEHE